MIDSIIATLKRKDKALEISPEEVQHVIMQYLTTKEMPLLPLWAEICALYTKGIQK